MKLNFEKYSDGLISAIVQDAGTNCVLMLGYMNAEAVRRTTETGRVTFFSRSRQKLWTKGETSGNYLDLVSITQDCDADTVLIKANPAGPICHTGSATCFGENNDSPSEYLSELESVIDDRRSKPSEESYVSRLFEKGLNKIAQKVGEEAVEVIIAAKDDDTEAFTAEAADLLFHYLVLLRAKDISIKNVVDVLKERKK